MSHFHSFSCPFLAGQQTPELPDLRAGSGRFCSPDSEPEDYFTWSSTQPGHRCGRVVWRDALCLVQDEVSKYSCRVRVVHRELVIHLLCCKHSCYRNDCISLYFRALAASAPIWQFPGMVPCGDFYKIVTQDFAKSGSNCDSNIRKSWKAINNVSSSGEWAHHDFHDYL